MPRRKDGKYCAKGLHLLKVQSYRCFYCLKTLPEKGFHMDHVVPLSRKGLHDFRNLVLACAFCNLSKGHKTGAEFRKQKRNST